METLGIDVSHHQGGSLNFVALRRAGIDFCFIKATEGAGFKDSKFGTNLKRARDAGMLVAAYHYLRNTTSAAAQVSNVVSVVPKDISVIPDVEEGSGNIALVREFVVGLRNAGYYVPLLYLPRWYWQRIGSPDLTGLPSLWSSRYPDNEPDTLLEEFKDVPKSYWDGYGNQKVSVLQFTSSAIIDGVRLDANAFQGTPEQLSTAINRPRKEDDDTVKNLILAQEAGSNRIWVGDGIHRRHVEDPVELGGLQYWIEQKGGNPAIEGPWVDLRVLGIDVTIPPNGGPVPGQPGATK
jgi:lysozyme